MSICKFVAKVKNVMLTSFLLTLVFLGQGVRGYGSAEE